MRFSLRFFHLLCLFQLTIFVQNPVVTSTEENKQSGPIINVTKHLFFQNFKLDDDPRISHELKLLGSAKLSREQGAIQIPDESHATDLKNQAGRALYAYPIRLLDPVTRTPASFETYFSFQFSNSTSSNTTSRNESLASGGSGLTFIIVPDEFTVGRPGKWLAMLNDACEEHDKVVAVEFDTRKNQEFGDPNDNHVGINLGSIISATTINVSEVGIFLKDGSIHQARILYDGPQRWMEVGLGLGSKPIYSGSIDLTSFLNEYMFVGFSASTGNFTQIHNIYSWNFTSTSQASLRIPSTETCESKIIQEPDRVGNFRTRSSPTKPPRSFLIFVALMILAIAMFLSLFYHSRQRNKQTSKSIRYPDKKQRLRPPNKPRRFTITEVSTATRGFNEFQVLGSDSRGTTFRGKLPNDCQVAIKRYSAEFLSFQLGFNRRRLLKEISAISKIRHPNLVPIRGWYQDNRQTMVVYDLYTNGSLDKWVFGAGVLPWTRRLKVVNDVADGLSFLHSKQLSHKNMKSSSVFLDVTFRAVLGDFGFVMSSTDSKRFEAAVSQKADVFEFGIFVLEVVSGRGRLLDKEEAEELKRQSEERNLVDFAWRMHEMSRKERVVDRRMGSLVNMEQAVKVLEIGLLCTLNENKGRPSMEEVVEFLCFVRPIPELPPTRPVAFFPYNSSNAGLCTGYACSFK